MEWFSAIWPWMAMIGGAIFVYTLLWVASYLGGDSSDY